MSALDDILNALHLGGGGGSPHGGTAPTAGGNGNPYLASSVSAAPSGGAITFGGSAGGGNPYLAGGGGSSAQSPTGAASQSLQKDLGYMGSNPDVLAAGQKVAAGKSGGGFWHDIGGALSHSFTDTVNALDYPRAAVVATAGGLDSLANGKGFNAHQWASNIAQHATTGHVLAELEGPKDAQSSTGKLNNSILGMIGDVALDPLTWIPGVDALKPMETGLKGLDAASSADKFAEAIKGGGDVAKAAQAAKDGVITKDTLGRLTKQGVAGLSAEEKEALGAKNGLRLGTRAHNLQLVPSAATDPLGKLYHQLGYNVRAKAAASSLAGKVMPHVALRRSVFDAVQGGDYTKGLDQMRVMKASSLVPGVASAFRNEHGPGIQDALSAFKPEEYGAARQALEGQGPLVGDDRVGALRGSLDNVAGDLKARGADIGHLDNYLPHQAINGAQKAAKGSRGAFASELARRLSPGQSLLGHVINNGSVDEINEIMRQEGNPDLFRTDLPSILDTYLHGAANRAGTQEFANRLDAMGITHSGDMARTPDEWKALAAQYGRSAGAAEKKAARVGERSARAGAVVDQAKAGFAMPTNGSKLAKAVQRIEQHAANRGVEPATQHGYSLDQIIEHGGLHAEQLGTAAAKHAASAQDLRRLMAEAARDAASTAPEPDPLMASTGAFAGHTAPQHVKDALQMLADESKKAADKQPSAFGNYFDKYMNLWRNYALAMPGKAIRHTLSFPAWGHYIGQSDLRDMPESLRIWKQYVKGGMDALKPEDQKMVSEARNLGLFHGHSFSHGAGIATEDVDGAGKIVGAVKRNGKFNPLSSDFAYFKGNRELQARLQDYSRFAMYRDARLNKGLGDLSAAEKVRSILGDPGNLTDWERSTARRAVPFYAFLRTQMPAQLKAMYRTPAKFVSFVNAEKEIGDAQKSPGLVPSYFGQDMAFQTPFHSGQNPLFASPDLPFTRINELATQPVAQLNPLLQMALESYDNTNPQTGAQFSPTAKVLPSVLDPIAPLLDKLGVAQPQAAASTDYGVTTPAGAQKITPLRLNQFENLAPLSSALIDMFSGTGRPGGGTAGDVTNLVGAVRGYEDGPPQQADVLWSRYYQLQQMIKNAQNVGKLPSYIRGYHA